MKFFIGLILSVVVLQALALPTSDNLKAPSVEVKPRNEQVDAFREEINRQFARFQTLYDVTNAAMRQYRLLHVDLVSRIYVALMTILGDEIEGVRQMAYDLDDMINARYEELGEMTECLLGVVVARNENSARVGNSIQECAIVANTTLSGLLRDVFYPTFAQIQTEASIVPISVIDILSRGNVLEDEGDILQYMDDRYAVFDLQWLGLVSQMLRWETNRFENEGLFLNSDMEICMADATYEFYLTNSRLEGEVLQCDQ